MNPLRAGLASISLVYGPCSTPGEWQKARRHHPGTIVHYAAEPVPVHPVNWLSS